MRVEDGRADLPDRMRDSYFHIRFIDAEVKRVNSLTELSDMRCVHCIGRRISRVHIMMSYYRVIRNGALKPLYKRNFIL